MRYDECSNGALLLNPTTGKNVNNGVLTVFTSNNLNGMGWRTCGNIATNGARGIGRDFTMIVCPDVVNFNGAAAYGQMPGTISWYRSKHASAPIAQMHEIGHNLGHGHSGKGTIEYADPTCNMGNKGSWSDTGTNFCFNAAKTWANGWYDTHHAWVDPSRYSYDGTLVGINAVKEKSITGEQDVVLKIASSGETDLYVMFNRRTGANNQVPQNGDQVVITEQSSALYETSAWSAALSEGQEYTQRSWSGSGTLVIKVCSLETGSPGSARILVYATGQEILSCVAASPIMSPVTSSPTKSPVSVDDTSCRDGTSKFALTENGKRKPCKFVFRKKTTRCQDPAAAEYCPVTCGDTSCTCEDVTDRFEMPNGNLKSCNWASKNTEKRCRNNFVHSYCPDTCGIC